jgi:hypothetical protein
LVVPILERNSKMATIQGVYVALFGRPADPAGLAYFNGITNNGANLASIASLAGTAEYQTRFTGQSNTQIVNSIYQSLFGRDAEAAGLNFFVDALNKGTLNINNIAIAILDGAKDADKTISANKIAAADLYTKSLDTATEIGAYTGTAAAAQGRAFIAGVTTTVPGQASVDAAITQMQIAGAAGNTITATSAITTLNLTTGVGATGDVKTTTNNNDTINAGANYTGNGSKIDAGLGVDTLNATVDGYLVGSTGLVQADGLKNVEIVNLTSVQAASAFDVANAKELTQLWHVAGANTAAANTSIDLSVSNLAQTATYGVRGDIKASADSVAFANSDASSSVKVAFDAAVGTGSLTVNNIGTLNLSNTGTSNLPITTAAKAMVVTGDGALTLAATATALETVTASGFSGTLTANLGGNNALKSYVGGTGIDTITIDTVHTNDQTIATGAGADTITVTGSQNVTSVANAVTTAPFLNSAKTIALTGGDGADTFVFGTTGKNYVNGDTLATQAAAPMTSATVGNVNAVDTAANLVKSLISITDFVKASDAIKIADGVTTGGGRQTILDADLVTISAQTDILLAAQKAASFTAVDKVALFNYGADAYMLVNSGTTAFEAGDTLIKVTGVQVADFTATNFAVI